MDNLKKRDYANFNNGYRGYPLKGNVNKNQPNYNRVGSGNHGNRGNDVLHVHPRNPDLERNVVVQYSNNKSSKSNPIATLYGGMYNTMQKRFTNVLYHGNKIENNKIDKDIEDRRHDLENEELVSETIRIEDETATVPKSVFVFITIAVIFATAIAFMITMGENEDKKVADKSETKIEKQADGDDGFETYASEEELVEQLEQLENEEIKNDNIVSEDVDKKNKGTQDSKTKTTDSNTFSDKVVNVNNSSGNVNTTTNDNSNSSTTTTVQSTNVTRATLKPEVDSGDSKEELAPQEDNDIFALPMKVPSGGRLYRSTSLYAGISEGKFIQYSNWKNETYGATVLKKDLDGIWLFIKGPTLNEKDIVGIYAYSGGQKKTVYTITITNESGSKSSKKYAVEGIKIPLTDGNYRRKGTTTKITELTVNSNVTLEKY